MEVLTVIALVVALLSLLTMLFIYIKLRAALKTITDLTSTLTGVTSSLTSLTNRVTVAESAVKQTVEVLFGEKAAGLLEGVIGK